MHGFEQLTTSRPKLLPCSALEKGGLLAVPRCFDCNNLPIAAIGAASFQRRRPISRRKYSLAWRRSTSESGRRPKRDFMSVNGRRRARASSDFGARVRSGAERSVMSGFLLKNLPEWSVGEARLAVRRVNVLKRPELFRKLRKGSQWPADSLRTSMV